MASDQNASAVDPQLAPPPLSTSRDSRLRLFYALWPDAATRAALAALQNGIGGRPTPADNLHLTLAFLGQQPDAILPLLRTVLASLSAAPLPLTLNHSGYFPRQRLAWIGPEPAPAALLELQQQLTRTLAQHLPHYQMAERFLPHVTLARKVAAAVPAPVASVAWRSSQIALVSSVTLAQGARYEVLAARVLDGSS